MAKQTPVVGNLFTMVFRIFETVLTCSRSYSLFLIPPPPDGQPIS